MLYLLPGAGHRLVEKRPEMLDRFGIMLTPAHSVSVDRALRYQFVGLDNGCYAQGESFDEARWLSWLDVRAPLADRVLFATAPDVVGDWAATWERSRPMLPEVRRRGFRAAVVAQDGCTAAILPWSEVDAVFIGGTTVFKESPDALEIVAEAGIRGKWAHIGRVTTRRRIFMAYRMGADSVDGTHLARRPDYWLPIIDRWMGEANHQLMLEVPA